MSQRTLEAPTPRAVPGSTTAVRPCRTPIMGYVRAVRHTSATSFELEVLMADRSTWTTHVPLMADPQALATRLAASHHPLAVRAELEGVDLLVCSCLVSSPAGPYRMGRCPLRRPGARRAGSPPHESAVTGAWLWPGDRLARRPCKMDHLAFDVESHEDMVWFREQLIANGYEVKKIITREDEFFVESIYFNDPNGVPLELATFDRQSPRWDDLDPNIWFWGHRPGVCPAGAAIDRSTPCQCAWARRSVRRLDWCP